MLKPDYPIDTERLRLRPLDATTDVDALLAYQSLPEVCRYIPYEPRTHEQLVARLLDPERNRSTLEQAGQAMFLGVELLETGELVGDVMLSWTSDEHRCGEIGYVFHPAVHGQGYATEAGRVLLELAFEGLDLRRVVARIDILNQASAGVLRRLGLREEAVLVENEWFKGRWSTEVDFAILAAEWRAAGDRRRSGGTGPTG